MKSRIIELSDVDEDLYQKLYYQSMLATPFQNLSWLKSIVYSSYGYKLKFEEYTLDNVVLGYYPFFQRFGGLIKVSSIRGGYDGYVVSNRCQIHSKVRSLLLKRNKVEDTIGVLTLSSKSLDTWVKDVTEPYQDIFEKLHKKTRNQIRKSLVSGVIVRKVENEEELKLCYSLYKDLVIKHKISKPLNYETFRYLGFSDGVDFIVALYGDNVISFSVFIHSKSECFYWLNASDNNFSKLNGTNGILNYVLEKIANDKDIVRLNFGAVPIGNDGLTHFKDRWGARKVSYNSFIEVVL